MSARFSPRAVLVSVAVLFAATVLLFVLHALTAQRIEHNENAWLEAQLNALVPPELHDNDLLVDHIQVEAEELGSEQPVDVFRARRQGQPTALVIGSVAPDGYGGPIDLLVGIREDGELLGVRILAHHETPGIGDTFERAGSRWLDAFRGHSLANTPNAGWTVQKDGGEFMQFTSATITPRAITKGVQRTLEYYQRHRQALFAPSPTAP